MSDTNSIEMKTGKGSDGALYCKHIYQTKNVLYRVIRGTSLTVATLTGIGRRADTRKMREPTEVRTQTVYM